MADYQRSNGVTSRNQQLAALEVDNKITPRLFIYGLGQYERDRFQGFSSRTTLSGGLGYSVIHTDAVTLDVKAGPAWRSTDFITGVSQSRFSGLAGADFGWRISPALKVTEGVNMLVDSDNTTLSSLSAIDAKLGSGFSARLSYQVDYQSSPPIGIKKTDTLTRATLVYGF